MTADGWILVIVTVANGFVSGEVTGFDLRPMPRAQCEGVLRLTRPVAPYVGLACVGPDGSFFELKDLE